MKRTERTTCLVAALRRAFEVFASVFTGVSKEAVEAGICDYSGQGRDRYGR